MGWIRQLLVVPGPAGDENNNAVLQRVDQNIVGRRVVSGREAGNVVVGADVPSRARQWSHNTRKESA